MKILPPIVLAVLCIPTAQALATWQSRDRIIIDEKEHRLDADPLGQYLWLNEKTDYFESEERSSACWRGYQARWTISEDKLFLLSIERCPKEIEADLKDLFGDGSSKPLFANWYSGYLTVTDGDVLFYDPSSYHEIRESYAIYQVDSGKVVRKMERSGRKELIDYILIGGEVVISEIRFEGESLEHAVNALLVKSLHEVEQYDEVQKKRFEMNETTFLVIKEAIKNVHISEELGNQEVNLSLKNLTVERCFHFLFEVTNTDYRISDSDDEISIEIYPKAKKEKANQSEVVTP